MYVYRLNSVEWGKHQLIQQISNRMCCQRNISKMEVEKTWQKEVFKNYMFRGPMLSQLLIANLKPKTTVSNFSNNILRPEKVWHV